MRFFENSAKDACNASLLSNKNNMQKPLTLDEAK